MSRSPLSWLGGLLVLAVVAGGSSPVHAADPPWVGTWVLTEVDRGEETDLLLFKLDAKDNKPQGEVLSAGIRPFQGAKIESPKVAGQALKFVVAAGRLSLNVTAYLPKDDDAPKKLYGFLEFGDQRSFIELSRSELPKLDPEKAVNVEAARALLSALQSETDKDKEAALKAILDKYSDRPVSVSAGLELVGLLAKRGAAEEELRKQAEAVLKLATRYGPEMKGLAQRELASKLTPSEKSAGLAVEYAQEAVKGLPEGERIALRAAALRVLLGALRKADKPDDARKVETTLAKIDDELDAEFNKSAIPFKPEAFAGRKGKSDRVVVLELFTGSECPPCVAADVAFDALLQTYKPTEVVELEYHLHIPRPDPLTNEDTLARGKYYGIRSTPNPVISGERGPAIGGGRADAKEGYEELRALLDKALEKDAGAQVKLTADRKGDKIDLQAAVSGLKKTSGEVKLRFVLIEDVVRYPGGNGQRLHHHVVRAFPGGVDGIALKEESSKQSATADLAEINKEIEKYLTEFKAKRPFRTDYAPMNGNHLKVVALIQDDGTKEILQAAQVDVPEVK